MPTIAHETQVVRFSSQVTGKSSDITIETPQVRQVVRSLIPAAQGDLDPLTLPDRPIIWSAHSFVGKRYIGRQGGSR